MSEQPWYAEGLRFKCSQCGDCCTGAPGYVWVNKAEIEALAEEIGLDLDEFEQKYVRKIGIRKSLVEFPNGDCVFFDGESRKCTVYHARPRQCRTWPFWRSNLRTAEKKSFLELRNCSRRLNRSTCSSRYCFVLSALFIVSLV